MSYAAIAGLARARGFGAYEPGWENIYGVGAPPPPDPTWGGNDGNDVPWYLSAVPLATVIGKTAASIWGNQYQPQPTYTPTYSTDYAALQAAALARANAGDGVGIGVDGSGIRLSDGSHIGWLPIGAVVFGFFLLQSRGFSRR